MPRLFAAACIATAVGTVLGASQTRAATASDLPGLVSPATSTHLPGKVVFAALVTPDLVAAEKFYTDLFRWQFTNAYVGSYLFGQAEFNGRFVAAIVQKPLDTGEHPAWRTFISTDDVDKTAETATAHGAKVLLDPHDIANLGRDALLSDPQGAIFGVLHSSSGDPADKLAAPGEWIWSSLITTDPEADANFYKTVLGYQSFDLPDPQEAKHVILASQDFARASINPIPDDHPNRHPRWISYVRVSDLAATVTQATAMGARVIVAPHVDRNGGTIALLADPAGALFGVLEWPSDVTGGESAAGDAK